MRYVGAKSSKEEAGKPIRKRDAKSV